MASDKSLVLNVGHITGLSMHDIDGDDKEPRARPGTIGAFVDAYGYRVAKYCRLHQSGGCAIGELQSRPANVSVTDITSGSTTHAVTTDLTADVHAGKLLYVLDNDDSAGAAPEGETSIIRSNSATRIDVEKDYPFSVALAANDDLRIISNWQVEDAADGDPANGDGAAVGVCLGRNGVSDKQYGWWQIEGYVVAKTKASAITAYNPVVADAAQIGPFGTDGQELWVGVALAAFTADQTAQRVPVNLKLFTSAGTGTAP
jgi:hypothetical protein